MNRAGIDVLLIANDSPLVITADFEGTSGGLTEAIRDAVNFVRASHGTIVAQILVNHGEAAAENLAFNSKRGLLDVIRKFLQILQDDEREALACSTTRINEEVVMATITLTLK